MSFDVYYSCDACKDSSEGVTSAAVTVLANLLAHRAAVVFVHNLEAVEVRMDPWQTADNIDFLSQHDGHVITIVDSYGRTYDTDGKRLDPPVRDA